MDRRLAVLLMATAGPARYSIGFLQAIAVVVLTMWGVSFLADILLLEWDPPAALHTAALMVLGALFGTNFMQKGQ